jgi:tetratricopeptide (TPR) repeat protein
MSRGLSILILFTALSAQADVQADKLTAAGIAEFTAAYQAWDGSRFSTAVDIFRQATTDASASCTNYYWLGTAQFHHMLQLQNAPANPTNQLAADAALNAAVEALTVAVKLDERHAESHALLGTLYGMKINGSVLRAAWFGPRVAKHRGKAMESGAHNPRVQYLLGMCQFHTAKKLAAYRETLTTLLAAEKLFEAEAEVPGGPLDPRWGRSSCWTFIGRTYESLGERTKAAEYFRKALAEHPVDHVAKDGLKRVTEKK